MRFACDKCKTKYSIDDARVRGKVLKIRCKACNNVITVRDPTPAIVPGVKSAAVAALRSSMHPADAEVGPRFSANPETTPEAPEHTIVSDFAPAPAPAVAPPPTAEWYVSFDGEQEGPLSLEKAAERVRQELRRGKQAHAWRDGFEDWLPIAAVPELARVHTQAPAWPAANYPKATETKPAPEVAKAAPRVASPIAQPVADESKATPDAPAPLLTPETTIPEKGRAIPAPLESVSSMPVAPAVSHVVKEKKPRSSTAPPIPEAALKPKKTLSAKAAAPLAQAVASETKKLGSSKPAASTTLPATEEPKKTAIPLAATPLKPVVVSETQKLGSSQPEEAEKPSVPSEEKKEEAQPEPLPPALTEEPASPAAAAVEPAVTAEEKKDEAQPEPLPAIPTFNNNPDPSGSGIRFIIDAPSPTPSLAPSLTGNAPSTAAEIYSIGGTGPASTSALPTGTPLAVLPVNETHPHVVYMATGTAPKTDNWLKWFAVASVIIIVLLLAALGYVLFSGKFLLVTQPAPSVAKSGHAVEDKPIALTDPQGNPVVLNNVQENKKTSNGRPHATGVTGKSGKASGDTGPSGAAAPTGSLASPLFPQFSRDDLPKEGHLPTIKERENSQAQISEAVIRNVMQTNKQSLTQCYERILKHDETLQKARIDVSVNVGISGMVTNVTLTGNNNTDLRACLSQAIKRWRFPSTGAEYEADFPLLLQAGY